MKIRNKYTSTIGFGNLTVLPDTVSELPNGFSANHPVIQFYLTKGWIEVAGEETPAPAPSPDKADETAKAEKTAALEAKVKALAKMKLEELQAEADRLAVSFAAEDTKAILVQKITDKYQEE
jgi:hypothetical protein